MNMRKMIAVVLSVLLALSMLAGCASGAPAKDDTRSGLTVALVVAGTFGDRSFYDSSKAGCDNMYYLMNHADEKALSDAENALLVKVEESRQRFISAMDDDMNTADAMGALFEIVKEANITLNDKSSKQAIVGTLDTLSALADVMGLLTRKPPEEALPEDIQALVDARADARKSKNWALSDQLRDQLKELGYSVEDTAKGQKVQKLAK